VNTAPDNNDKAENLDAVPDDGGEIQQEDKAADNLDTEKQLKEVSEKINSN